VEKYNVGKVLVCKSSQDADQTTVFVPLTLPIFFVSGEEILFNNTGIAVGAGVLVVQGVLKVHPTANAIKEALC